MTTETEQKYVFYRLDLGAPLVDPMRTRLDEKRCRLLLGSCLKDIDRAINTLKRGKEVRTRYAIYSAEPI